MSDNPTLDAISSDLADIKRQLESKAQAEVTGAIQGVHTKLDNIAKDLVTELVSEVKAHLSTPRALIASFVGGCLIGGGAVMWAVHIAKVL